ncbi:MAG: polysaccharide biosynthesis tyrosine autokinase, partial [Verrucomicrobia bacterium]|nr:polysaccharide biosynthesis tyrosine autokinase [Verrucomicrobiota bacterium]
MADLSTGEGQPIDFRIYLGMILFRWQIITVCFLYALLGGVLFLQLTPKKYVVHFLIRSFDDPVLHVGPASPWSSIVRHQKMIADGQARSQAVKRLTPEWGEKLGDKRKMILPLKSKRRGTKVLEVMIHTENPEYGIAFLSEIASIHRDTWEESRVRSTESASRLLERELEELEERIRAAEDDIFEYERLNDIQRVTLKAEQENAYIGQLVSQRRALRTSLWMMETEFPALKEAEVGVIEGVNNYMLDEQGNLKLRRMIESPMFDDASLLDGLDMASPGSSDSEPSTESILAERDAGATPAERGIGWVDLRYRLVQLETMEAEMVASLKADHPRVQRIRAQITHTKDQLKLLAAMQLRQMWDQYRAIQIKHDALEAAEYKWQAVNYQRAQKQAEMKRLQSRLSRYEENYSELFKRLHDLNIQEETNTERFTYSDPVSSSRPVWPEPTKVLLLALGIGLGAGFGLAILSQVLDNKVQSIQDVEKSLGIPFLGGVPFWVHSGLEKAIRPIVTEEHSVGAVEAYRALRTSIVAAMEKAGEKLLIVTSADSREGKTLTSLNTAIMMAQMRKRVLLVDMDLRRGRLHRSLGLEKQPGVTDVLRGERTLRSIIVPTRIENLDLAPPGAAVDDAPELLQSAGLEDLFVEIQDYYDFIILDTSPVLRVTDTVILATQGFGVVLYVARVNHTPKPLIRYSLDVLKDARVIGMVLNSIEMHKISSLYYTYQYPNYAYYSNAYSYGYSYAYYGDQAEQESKKFRRHGGMVNESRR